MSAGEIVRKFYEAAQRKDLAACRALLADDLVFVGLFETYPNPDAYLAAFTGLLGITKRIDVKTIVSEGDQAAIFFDLETTGPVEGTTFVAEWHQVRNERIVRVQSAFDGRPWAALFAGR
jgi:ketosteroid isomerase-like protein